MSHSLDAPATQPDRSAAVQGAIRAARAAAGRSGVLIREIDELSEIEEVSRLLSRVWSREATSPQMTADLLRALAKTGNYVTGAFVEEQLVGAAVAFFASPPSTSLHSHIAGVADRNQARNVGYALKLHQRAWALLRGVSTITWTYDPLVRRNAYFNIAKLGAQAIEYLPNFYGEMRDRINAGDQSDRVLVEWALLAPAVIARCDSSPPGPAAADDPSVPTVLRIADGGAPHRDDWVAPRAVLAVPPDVERLRIDNAPLAHAWRIALRETLGAAMTDGGRVVGFRRDAGYVVER